MALEGGKDEADRFMKEAILAKYGELALKGQNRPQFERDLLGVIRERVAVAGNFRVYKAQSTVYVEPADGEADIGLAFSMMEKVFGIASLCRAAAADKDAAAISAAAVEYLAPELKAAKTFKVSARRSDKSFPLNSMQLAAFVGGAVLEAFPHLSADMEHPDTEIVAEVRDYAAYIHGTASEGAGGMPPATGGRAAVLLSGGIDSPVAAYMMAKRGLSLIGVHFMSPPYTGALALEKVTRLAGILSGYTGSFTLFAVPFTDVQVLMRKSCPAELFTVLMRRSMLRIAEMICGRERCGAIVTGESLGQVASQTLPALVCTDAAATRPVLRPLIGMDKVEITRIARKIGTFETSILPYEDCCTVFTPRHPKIKPALWEIERAEQSAGYIELEAAAAEHCDVRILRFDSF